MNQIREAQKEYQREKPPRNERIPQEVSLSKETNGMIGGFLGFAAGGVTVLLRGGSPLYSLLAGIGGGIVSWLISRFTKDARNSIILGVAGGLVSGFLIVTVLAVSAGEAIVSIKSFGDLQRVVMPWGKVVYDVYRVIPK